MHRYTLPKFLIARRATTFGKVVNILLRQLGASVSTYYELK